MDTKSLSCPDISGESPAFLSEQIITYIGNKRSLLGFIGNAVDIVKKDLKKDKLDIIDIFSGSGIVSRYFKQFANYLYANDLEDYCVTLNKCYLANKEDVDLSLLSEYLRRSEKYIEDNWKTDGFIYKLYAPKDDRDIKRGERVFFTTRNAQYIDTARTALNLVPEAYKPFLLAPLLYGASVHNNTSGVFKGFYKNSDTGIGQYGGNGRNALTRILGDIRLQLPVFSRFSCTTHIMQYDANELYKHIPTMDLAYIDPPYNQHPYGSNYFMLNLINSYEPPCDISPISGIPKQWNKSPYNVKKESPARIYDLCRNIPATYLLISFNSEGFISKEDILHMLLSLGEVTVLETNYNTFRGSRNLNSRDLHVKEYLFLVKKRGGKNV